MTPRSTCSRASRASARRCSARSTARSRARARLGLARRAVAPVQRYFVSMRPTRSRRSARRTSGSTPSWARRRARGASRCGSSWRAGAPVLTTRFADFCGHILVQNRASTGRVAPCTSRTTACTPTRRLARTALAEARLGGERRTRRAVCVARVRRGRPAGGARAARSTAGERVTDISITARPGSLPREPLFAPLSSSRLVNVGGRWR